MLVGEQQSTRAHGRSAYLGGLVAQEVIKMVTKPQYDPANGYFDRDVDWGCV